MLTVAAAADSSGPYVTIAVLLAALVAVAVYFGVQQPAPHGLGVGFWPAVITAGSAAAGTYFLAEAIMKNMGLL
ncbi:hypothetical protein ACF09E_34500 [Streptomyces sp. NPDC014891]|uniref:hypothetical protein n=1 Tax=Streptomyces sp. NPDC014891 TaxID=3364929 RepID=UPI0036F6229C